MGLGDELWFVGVESSGVQVWEDDGDIVFFDHDNLRAGLVFEGDELWPGDEGG